MEGRPALSGGTYCDRRRLRVELSGQGLDPNVDRVQSHVLVLIAMKIIRDQAASSAARDTRVPLKSAIQPRAGSTPSQSQLTCPGLRPVPGPICQTRREIWVTIVAVCLTLLGTVML